ncbi:MAG: molybdenum cofactor biosynthesis protein MoaE [Ancrocorticia sp.]
MSIENATSHEEATWKVQNRGYNDGSDAVVVRAGVSHEPIDMAELEALVSDDSVGAIVTFNGRVRNHDDGNSVVAIDYEAHPDAGKVVEKLAAEVAAGSGACKIAIVHRAGHLEIGDIALGAAVSASHRKEAFRTLEAAVEQVKLQLPVWKRQEFEDGSHEWTGSA